MRPQQWATPKFYQTLLIITNMTHTFKTPPICEACGEEEAYSFSTFSPDYTDWEFTGACTSQREYYYIEFDRFFRSSGSVVAWLSHLSKKPGMDWDNFMSMMVRLRDASGSRGQM